MVQIQNSPKIQDKTMLPPRPYLRLLLIRILMAFLLMLLSVWYAQAQCLCEIHRGLKESVKHLEQNGGYTYLKSYHLNLGHNKHYSYIFSKGTRYKIMLNPEANTNAQANIELVDAHDQVVARAIPMQTGDTLQEASLAFECVKTGIYRIRFSLRESERKCIAGVIGMKR